jgi:hypothetical protein
MRGFIFCKKAFLSRFSKFSHVFQMFSPSMYNFSGKLGSSCKIINLWLHYYAVFDFEEKYSKSGCLG